MLCNWLTRFASLSQLIRSKTKAIRDLLARIFPRLYLLRVLIGSLCCLPLLCLVRVITLVLVFQHSIEKQRSGE